ncbi:MAG: hypothetical protein D3906_15930, partial [Candidatus Electrothrix sp. AUS1_2]|nr:hypothetical protein [Candidatus Electrothrix sp. AUS1_2]
MFKSSIIPLYKDFPIHKLSLMDFGSADGDRDELIEDVFVRTESIEKFLQGRHSIIIGSIGSGKSALFNLLKKSSRKLNIDNNHIIVPIEEMISFQTLNSYISEYISKFDKKHLYQVFWKFYITAYICREICNNSKSINLSGFDKKQLKDFLAQINFRGIHENIVEKFFNVLNIPQVTIRATVLSTPINVSVDSKKECKNDDYMDLDNIIKICDSILSENNLSCMVIVDNIDKLISVEEYDMQCSLVEGLLHVEDDIRRMKKIKCRIFLRSDIFDRIDFSGLGFDKTYDNTLELKWSDDEIICFLARRIMYVLGKFHLMTYYDVIMTTNLSDFQVDKLSSEIFQEHT